MKIGFAEKEITPDLPFDRPHKNGEPGDNLLRDPHKARAVVFDNGKERIALVGCDCEAMPRGIVLQAREKIEETCGIKGTNVMISATHAHVAPLKTIVEPDMFDSSTEFVQKLAYHEYSCPSKDYVEFIVRQIAAAVRRADIQKKEALCCVGTGKEADVTFNRRFRMKDGLTWTHPGKKHPDIIKPAGNIDPDVGVIGVWDMDEKFMGCVVNFGCHGTTSPGGLSADWVYFLEETIRVVMGQTSNVVFLNGACGDVAQINNQTDEETEIGEKAARRVGQSVGAEVLKILVKAPRGKLSTLTARSEILSIPRMRPNPEKVRHNYEIFERGKKEKLSEDKEKHAHDMYYAKKIIILDELVNVQPKAEVEIQAIQLGPAIFISNPTEFFVKSGRQVKESSPFKFTYIVELANGCVGYTPPKEEFGPNGGGMETWLIDYRNLVPEAEEMIVQTSIKLANEFIPDAKFEHKKITEIYPPFAKNPPELE